MITFGSLFSGIGGFDLGFERAGMRCAWQVEIDDKCNETLARHWPDVQRFGDVRNVGRELPAVDLISGGFPCQDVSVAGKRKGLAGKRSGLWFEFYRILAETRPTWVVIENVPGLLSSHGGRDFATILSGLVGIGYRCAWRVLDAQYFGVAQRRRRLFAVGYLGDGRAAEVLFEREGSAGDTTPSREAGATTAPLAASGAGTSRTGNEWTEHEMMVAFTERTRRDGRNLEAQEELAYAITNPGSGGRTHSRQIAGRFGVRRLTPTECARLQGFPDGWTEGHSDSARYRMLGNAVCVPVAEWIGRQIVKSITVEKSISQT